MVWETDSTGLIQNVNRRWSELTGRPASDAMGLPWLLPVPPDDQRRLEAAWANAVATGGQFECEYRFVALDGNLRWMLTRATPIRNSEGTILRWVGSDMEITELKEAEERTRFLMREVNHRSKNLLAVVQAVAKQTAVNTDPRAFAARFGERLQGLSATQDLLIHNDWKGASLRDLIRSQITHFEDLFDGRILLNGPSVRITASSAQNLGLAFHELATNAGKYGALSSSQGELHITWNIDEAAEGRYFEIVWKERKGPPVTPPRRKGFGYLLITKVTEQALHGTVDLAYGTSGLTWTLRAPLSAVEAATFK